MITYHFAKEFTRYPGGRLRKDGPWSGQQFREDVLLKLLAEHDVVRVDLSGARGFGSSFLDEAFGEAAKRLGVKKVKESLELTCDDDPMLLELISQKIEKATQ